MTLARSRRPRHRARAGRPDGHRGAAEGAHPADLRGHQRGESRGHDAVAAEQLWQLYLATYNELTRELETERIEAPPRRRRWPISWTAFRRATCARTRRRRSPRTSRWSARAARGVAVDVSRRNGRYRLTLATRDRPFLFASVAGTLSGFGMNILKAEAFANRRARCSTPSRSTIRCARWS